MVEKTEQDNRESGIIVCNYENIFKRFIYILSLFIFHFYLFILRRSGNRDEKEERTELEASHVSFTKSLEL